MGELSAITFPGAPYEHVFFVADTEVTGSMVPDEVNVYLWRQGFQLFFPMRGKDHWRIVGILPASLRGRDDVNFEAVIPQSSFYLMRPDGHVGLCGARLQSSRVARYVFETVRLKAFGT